MKWFGLFAVVFFISCSTTKKVEDLTQDDILITMSKEGCFGNCPVYVFTMYEGGYCEFLGKENTYKQGKHGLQLSKDKFKELKAEIKAAELFQFEDYYESKIPDLPNVTISYFEKDTSKTIVGKRERPSQVHKIQFLLEQVAESKEGWTIIDGSVEEKKPKFDNSKIIISLKDGAQLSRWFNSARENYTIRIIKQMDNSYDKWLVSYDTQQYSPNEIIETLKKDNNVSSAEFLRIDP